MRSILIPALAAGFVASIGMASAAGAVNLTQQQKTTIKSSLSTHMAQNAPNSFTPHVGAQVPQSVDLKSLPDSVSSKIHAIRNDKFAKLDNNDIVIANSNRKVVAVINNDSMTNGASSMSTNSGGGMNSTAGSTTNGK